MHYEDACMLSSAGFDVSTFCFLLHGDAEKRGGMEIFSGCGMKLSTCILSSVVIMSRTASMHFFGIPNQLDNRDDELDEFHFRDRVLKPVW